MPIIALVISACALLVSLGSATVAYLGYQESKKFNEITIRPILNTGGPIFDPPESTSWVQNRGAGAAYINRVRIQYDKKEITRSRFENLFIEAQDQFNKDSGTDYQCTFEMNLFHYGQLIESRQRIMLFKTKGDCPKRYQYEFLLRAEINFEYSSLGGDVYRLDFMMAPPGTDPDSLFTLPR